MSESCYVLESNSLVLDTLIELTFVTNLSSRVFLKTSVFTTLLSLVNSSETVFSLLVFILPNLASKLVKSDFATKLDVSAPVSSFKSAFF